MLISHIGSRGKSIENLASQEMCLDDNNFLAHLSSEHDPGGGLRCQGQPEARALATVSPGHVISVDVDVREELEQETLGHLDHSVDHTGAHSNGPGHTSDPLDLPLVSHLNRSQGLFDWTPTTKECQDQLYQMTMTECEAQLSGQFQIPRPMRRLR